MGFVGLLAIALLSQKGSPSEVTLSGAVARVPEMLRKIEERTGASLTSSPAMANEVLLVRVRDVPLQDLLKRIAQATSGKWVSLGEASPARLELRPDEEVRRREEAEERAGTVAEIREAVVRELGESSPPLDETSALQAVMRFQRDWRPRQGGSEGRTRMPEAVWRRHRSLTFNSRSLWPVVQTVGEETLASLPVGQRWEFSVHPRGRERSMGARGTEALARIASDREVLTEALRRLGDEALSAELGFITPAAVPTTPERLHLRVTRPRREVMGLFLDTWNSTNVHYSSFLNPLRIRPEERDLGVPSKPPWEDARLEFSPTTRMLAAHAKPAGGQYIPPDPAPREPLADGVGEGLLAIAERLDRDVVACLPDSAYLPVLKLAQDGGTTSLGRFARVLGAHVAADNHDGGILLLRPRYCGEMRQDRLDRAALDRLLTALRKSRDARLRDLGSYAAVQPDGALPTGIDWVWLRANGFLTWDSALASLASPATPEVYCPFEGRDALRFYAALSAAQLRHLEGGGWISYSSLSPRAREALRTRAFLRNEPVSLRTVGRTGASWFGFADFPANVRVSLSGSTVTDVAMLQGERLVRTVTPMDLGTVIAVRERGGDPLSLLGSYSAALATRTKRLLNFQISKEDVGGGWEMTMPLQEQTVNRHKTTEDWRRLPPEIHGAIERGLRLGRGKGGGRS